MELLKLILKEHRGLVVAALAVLAMVAVLSMARCAMVQGERTMEAQKEEITEQGEDPVGDGDAELSETDKALAKLTDDQRAKMDEYDSQTTEFIAELTSNVWTARNDSYFLTFTGVTFTDHAKGEDGTEATIHPYVVSDLITHAPTTADGKSTEVAEAVIETDEGSFVLKHTLVTDTETGKSTAKISSSAFTVFEADGYTRTAASDGSLEVKGLNGGIKSMLGGDEDELGDALRDLCSLNVPTATEAKWRGIAERDWNEGTVTTWFDLNNSGKSSVSVTYGTEDGKFTVKNSYGSQQ